MSLNVIAAAPADIDALTLALTYLNGSDAGAAIMQQGGGRSDFTAAQKFIASNGRRILLTSQLSDCER
jgi:hypothetical protein